MNLRSSSFASSSLEHEYQSELAAEKIRLTRILVLVAVPINLSFIVLDLWAVPSALAEVWLVRGVMTLALVVLFATTWLEAFPRWYSAAGVFMFLWLGAGILAMILLAEPGDLATQAYYGGLLLLIMGVHTMTYLRVSVASAVTLLVTVAYALVAWHHPRGVDEAASAQIIAHLFFFAATGVIGVVGQTLRDRYSRENYLLRHSLQRDVQLKEEETRRASFLAEHDPLTGLANRLKLERDLVHMLEHAREDGRRLVLMFVDLDHFKPVNDTHGHAVGDRVLRVLGDRLRRAVAGDDLVGRVGGDEFVVATLVDPGDAHAVERVVSSVAAAVETRIDLRGEGLHLSASIGVAAYPGDGDDIDQLLHRADEQMYRVKRSGKGQVSMTDGCLGLDEAS